MMSVAITPYTPNLPMSKKLSTTFTPALSMMAGRVRLVSLAHWYPISKYAEIEKMAEEMAKGKI